VHSGATASVLSLVAAAMLGLAAPSAAQQTSASAGASSKKPNIVVIFADDVGVWNVSAYHRGMMGGRTPNIDRIAKEGALLTDYYAQQSCTAGRAAFITGQIPFRTGLLKVGLPRSCVREEASALQQTGGGKSCSHHHRHTEPTGRPRPWPPENYPVRRSSRSRVRSRCRTRRCTPPAMTSWRGAQL
jgi:hypothetical protein